MWLRMHRCSIPFITDTTTPESMSHAYSSLFAKRARPAAQADCATGSLLGEG